MRHYDPVVVLLTGLLVFFVVALFASEIFFTTDAQFFQAVSGMATGVLGALLGLLTKREGMRSTDAPPSAVPNGNAADTKQLQEPEH